MRIVNQIAAFTLLLAGIVVMFLSSMAGGGLSGIVGFPLFVAGLGWLLLPGILERRRRTRAGRGGTA